MNKRANKKAFFIILCVGLMYATVAFNITERFTMKRIFATERTAASANLGGAVPVKDAPDARPSNGSGNNTGIIEPGFLIAVPFVGSLIEDGILERDGLLRIRRTDGSTDFKKPVDILRDRDLNGLTSIAEITGKKQITRILASQGIVPGDDLTLNDIITGKGYKLNIGQLKELYVKYVGEQYAELFPLRCSNIEIKKKNGSYELAEVSGTRNTENATADVEWNMPDLSNLAMRTALEQISAKTSKVKVHGVGYVVDQEPKPGERLKGEVQCSLYGRLEKQ
ncbi:MAG TPA: PASTA domain-containing protein [Syntrophorhabdaceae bacterium]|nr:PASTA domain-containing protein [Syntrophorhabdaceae bacterium]